MTEEKKVIDEANYSYQAPRQRGPAAIGKGGDPLFMNIRATKTQLEELLDETTTVQDWIQRETCNNVALACLNNENLKAEPPLIPPQSHLKSSENSKA